jgi:3'-5' exoribonuclease
LSKVISSFSNEENFGLKRCFSALYFCGFLFFGEEMVRKRTMISDLLEGDIIIPDSRCYFLVRRANVRLGKNGQKYIDADLFDGVAGANCKVWDVNSDVEESLKSGNIIKVLNGKVSSYQSAIQIVINDADIVSPDELEKECAGILPESKWSASELREKWDDVISTLEPVHADIIKSFETHDPRIWNLFTVIPAGRSMHHASRRGLWEHSLNVAELSGMIASMYETTYPVNRSLVVLSALIHDVGKIFEFQLNRTTSMVERYSDRGKLLGHIYMGASWVEKLLSNVCPDDSELKMELLHVMLSHHGEYEFGSPKKPKTMEALIVSMADNLDANMDAVNIGFNSEMDENWTKSIYSLQRAFYRPGNGEKDSPDDMNGQEL